MNLANSRQSTPVGNKACIRSHQSTGASKSATIVCIKSQVYSAVSRGAALLIMSGKQRDCFPLGQAVGSIIDRLRGRPRISAAAVRRVWYSLESPQDYFHKVLRNVIRRDETLAEVFMSKKQYAQNDAERDFVLALLASRMADFYANLMQDEVLNNVTEFRKQCFTLGMQHAAFSTEPLKLIYWSELTLAMIEELESSGICPSDDLQSWQAMLHVVNEQMIEGYQHARSASKEVH